MNKTNLLEVRNISKIFNKSGEKIKAVDNVTFSLKKGECIGIVGESGCGKTTLARMIIGIEKITSGNILLNGEEIKEISDKRNKKMRKNIQMVFQNPISSFSPRMFIVDYLYEPLRNYKKMSKKDSLPIIKKCLNTVELEEDCLEKYPHEFSGGQLQRISIARAIIIEPQLVICDEATSALDVSIQKQILDLLEKLQRNYGLSYIFIGHDLPTVQRISQRIIVMHKGRIVEVLNSKNFKNCIKTSYTKKLLEAVFEIS